MHAPMRSLIAADRFAGLARVVDFGAHWFTMEDAFGRQKSMNPAGQSPVWCSEF